MATKRRSIEPEIYRHPFLLQQPLAGRHLYHYLIEVSADDEGRFRTDILTIIRGCFSPIDEITPEVGESLFKALAARGGVVLLYKRGGETFGFLRGWYEHQHIDKRYRSESSLPPPPINVHSWDQVDAIRLSYAAARELKDPDRARSCDALRWEDQQAMAITRESRVDHARNVRESLRDHAQQVQGTDSITIPCAVLENTCAEVDDSSLRTGTELEGSALGEKTTPRINTGKTGQKSRVGHARVTRGSRVGHASDWTGLERTGEEREGDARAREPEPDFFGTDDPPETAPDPPPAHRAEDDHLHAPEAAVWDVLLAEITPALPRTGNGYCNRREWALELARCDADENFPLHGDDLAAALRRSPPSVRTVPRRYLEILERRFYAEQGEIRRGKERAEKTETLPASYHERFELPPDLTPEEREAARQEGDRVRQELVARGVMPERQPTTEEIAQREREAVRPAREIIEAEFSD